MLDTADLLQELLELYNSLKERRVQFQKVPTKYFHMLSLEKDGEKKSNSRAPLAGFWCSASGQSVLTKQQ